MRELGRSDAGSEMGEAGSLSFGDGQAPGGSPGIVQGGDDGEHRGGIESQGAEHDERHPDIHLAQQDCEQSQDLGTRVGFTEDAGPEIAHTEADVEQRGDDENPEIAAKHQHGDAPRHQLLVHEHEKQGAEQEFIGDRVEVLTDLRLLLEQAGGQTIQTITQPGYYEEAKRGPVVRLQNRDHKKRYEAQAQESKQVRSCAQFFQQGFPIFMAAAQNLDGT